MSIEAVPLKNMRLRSICREDNEALVRIIRDTLIEFNANQPGSAFDDKATDDLHCLFQTIGSIYYVAEFENKIVGGAGLYPTNGLPADTCELVRMYLIPETRGSGVGKTLMDKCLGEAKKSGYKKIYLETKLQLSRAIKFYKQYGFEYLQRPMGNSGHYGCEIRMLKSL